ncbi:DegT/DnrJ/EryC1/StrS aminotransferase [Rhodospirillaceae bacterium LM-1]|nr:DegT/DnrJ/EryC1/StrS aminotransferase [Rhodospirillaceae bacterium LM-1]
MIEDLLIDVDNNLRAALECIDHSAQGIAFVTGSGGRLLGVLTDGDIRRALLRGRTLETPISEVYIRNCASLHISASREKIQASLRGKITCIPLLDDQDRPVDYASNFRHRRIPFAEPYLGGNEFAYVTECLQTNWISSQGTFIGKFEAMFAEKTHTRHAVASSNGTSALHLAMAALGIGPGDEVIVPDLTFAASASSIVHAGATPVLVDVDKQDWNLNLNAVRAAITPRTKAIMVVHLYGQPADMDGILRIAKEHGLFVVEDAAEALGSYYKGAHVGSLGDAAAFSFFGNKLITTGEGGMVTFRDEGLAKRARILRDHGMDPERRYWHVEIGYNYRMTNIQAALGLAQMEKLEVLIERKREIARRYREGLADLPFLTLPSQLDGRENIYWAFSILWNEELAGLSVERAQAKLLNLGIETRPLFLPLHDMPPFKKYAGDRDFSVSTSLSKTGFSLPSFVTLEETEIRHVVGAVKRLCEAKVLLS